MTTPMEMVVHKLSIGFLFCSVIVASPHQDSLQIHLRSEVYSKINSGLLSLAPMVMLSLPLSLTFFMRRHCIRIIFPTWHASSHRYSTTNWEHHATTTKIKKPRHTFGMLQKFCYHFDKMPKILSENTGKH